VFSKIERLIKNKKHESWLEIVCENNPGEIGKIGTALGNKEIQIKQIESNNLNSYDMMEIKLLIILPKSIRIDEVINLVTYIEGVKNVKIE